MSELRVALFHQQKVPLRDAQDVFTACQWGWPGDLLAEKAFSGSFVSVIAYEGDEPVGFSRAISDGIAYALVVDTMVVPAKMRRGIGKSILQVLLDFLKQNGVRYAKLISSKEGKEFYQDLGFAIRSVDEPGMLMSLT
jgi:GNAT superfamily N-acetyltransferase